MSTKDIKLNCLFSRSWAAVIASSVLLASAQTAQAGNHQGTRFKDFREQNLGMTRHAARRIFQQEVRNNIAPVNGADINILIPTPSVHHIPRRADVLRPERLNDRLQIREVRGQTLQSNDIGNTIRLRSGLDLDLTSSARNITLGKNLFADHDSIEINSGGVSKTLNAGSLISAAEYIAAKQVLSGGGQKLSVDGKGIAVGGEVDLNAITDGNDVMRAANLVVSSNVTTTGDFSRRSDFKLLGDLDNFGTVHATSSDSNVRSGAIRADDINNYLGATISSTVDLTLDAAGNLNNQGTIVSTAGLTISAGNSVNNSGTVSGANDVSVVSSHINNHGTIQSTAGNLTLDGAADSALLINNQQGTFSALNGSINVRNSAYNGSQDTYVSGGDLLSREVNLNAGQASLNVSVNELTGTVNQTGLAAHVLANTALLSLGRVCLTGDPTYYNTLGDIDIAGSILVGENLVIIAAGNITSADGITIQAGDADSQGFDITLIAGADFDVVGGDDQSVLGPMPPINPNFGEVTLSGKKSQTGGGIILGNNVNLIARAEFTTGPTSGGSVFLNAFGGKGVDAGVVDVSGTTIRTGGSLGGDNGHVFINAGATSGTALITAVIDTTGGTGEAGSINLFTQAIVSSEKGESVIYDASGNRTSNAFLTGGKTNKNASILVTNPGVGFDLNSSGELDMFAGNEIYIQGDVNAVDDVELFAGGDVRDGGGAGPVTASEVFINAGGNIGSVADPFGINADVVDVFAGGDVAAIAVTGTGALDIEADSDDVVLLQLDGRDVTVSDSLEGGRITVVANTLVSIEEIFASESASFTVLSGDLTDTPFVGSFFAPALNLSATNGNVGSIGNPIDLPFGTKEVSAQATGDIFISNQTGKAVDISGLDGQMVVIGSSTGLAFTGIVNAAILDVEIDTGTLSIEADLLATESITLEANSTKGKITFANQVVVQTNSVTDGDISISVGATSATPFVGPIANVDQTGVGGTITITGSGLKAKAPLNLLNVKGADILINNGNKVGNISLGGAVLIEADPPVPEGATSFYIPAAIKTSLLDTGITFGATQQASVSATTANLATTSVFSNTDGATSAIVNGLTANGLSQNAVLLPGAKLQSADDSVMMVAQPSRLRHDAFVCTDLELANDSENGNGFAVKPDTGSVSLIDGNGLFIPSKDTVVETSNGVVEVAAGSVVLISAGKDHLSVYDLHDGTARGVSVNVNGQRIALSPGRHVCVSSNSGNTFAEVNPIETIGHRGLVHSPQTNGKHLFSSEFSVLSAADAVRPLKQILTSNSKDGKKIASAVLKTTAVLMHLSARSEDFALHVTPRMVALNK